MQDRAETTRRSLLEAAAQLFNERGYAGTSISDISELSGRTSGAVYFHYTSKERLALAVVEAHFATWPRLVERHDVAGLPALERLVRLSFAVARAFRDDTVVRAGARLWAERRAINETLPVPFVGWIDTVRRLLTQARDGGELAAHVDPAREAHSVVCAFFGLHTVSDALEDRIGLVDQLADLWLLLLPALQARPDAAALVARARRGTEEPEAPAHAPAGASTVPPAEAPAEAPSEVPAQVSAEAPAEASAAPTAAGQARRPERRRGVVQTGRPVTSAAPSSASRWPY